MMPAGHYLSWPIAVCLLRLVLRQLMRLLLLESAGVLCPLKAADAVVCAAAADASAAAAKGGIDC